MINWLLKSLEKKSEEKLILFADYLGIRPSHTRYNWSCQNHPAKILVYYFLTTQKSLMLVFYIFGFYMILLILTVIVLLMLYCFDFMPWIWFFFHCKTKSILLPINIYWLLAWKTFSFRMQNNSILSSLLKY